MVSDQSIDPYQRFDQIYQGGGWNGMGSGPGSNPQTNTAYLTLLKAILQTPGIVRVLDIGCGDWQLMSAIRLQGHTYRGWDVSPTVIRRNHDRYAGPYVAFNVGNPLVDYVPPCDLLIMKDVLQHVPTADAQRILELVLPACRWALITNDYVPDNVPDIEVGGYRPLNLLRPPFNLSGVVVLSPTSNVHGKFSILTQGSAHDSVSS